MLQTLWPVVEEVFVEEAIAAQPEEETVCRVPLRRLGADWQPPLMSPAPLPAAGAAESPSEVGESRDEAIFSGWESLGRRHVGTVVHEMLERLCGGSGEASPGEQRRMIERQLCALGVPAAQVTDAADRVVEAIERTLKSERGRWILADHDEAQNELALSGVMDGRRIHAAIDRTFVDEAGRRWVIDYKTSSPAGGEGMEEFLQREAERYREQLRVYVRLLQAMEPERPISAALYFPLLDAWCPLEM